MRTMDLSHHHNCSRVRIRMEGFAMTLIDRLSKLEGPDREDAEAWSQLCNLTFAIQHNPNCPAKFLIRLPGKSGRIDMKPYADRLGFIRHQTGDILGFGKTLHEAARIAILRAKEASKP